jgi:hypothetical protein
MGGAPAGNIVVFEDVLSRRGGVASSKVVEAVARVNAAVEEVAARVNHTSSMPKHEPGSVVIVPTRIRRDVAVDATNFGIHLARHYKHVLDHMLTADTPDQLAVQQVGTMLRSDS